LVELLVVIAITGLLLTIALPVLGSVRENARQTQCASNLRQWGMALAIYVNDNHRYLPIPSHTTGGSAKDDPSTEVWFNALPLLVDAPQYTDIYDGTKTKQYANTHIWWCPTARAQNGPGGYTASGNAFDYAFNTVLDGTASYGPNAPGQLHIALHKIPAPAVTLSFTEPDARFEYVSIGGVAKNRHASQCANFLLLDGHVASFLAIQANAVYSGPGEPINTPYWTAVGGQLVWGSFRQ
jgi:prepilin-type processing-associated H-X9-DG protein